MNMELITQGAEGRVYKTVWLDKEVVVKERFRKKYRHPDLDKYIIKERIKAEARALVRCQHANINAPVLYDVDVSKGVIITEYLKDGMTVRNKMYKVNRAGQTYSNELADEIGKMVANLHSNHIIHGDLTTSNMILKGDVYKDNVYLIDFGLSSIDEKCEDKAVDLYVLETAILTTHPKSKEFTSHLLACYSRYGGPAAESVLKRLDEVRVRGRKKLCFG